MSESGSAERARFKISTHSNVDNCVEVGQLGDGSIAVRHSRRPDSGTVFFTEREWQAFVAGVKDGEFDSF